jgi:DNA-binding GntR family transcriptional regulator
MAGRPQRLTSLGSDALEKIRDALKDGTLAPGQRLRETDLAERFSMSRTPVRDAIQMLRAKGLVTHKDGALVITRLDRRQLDEIYEMRETMEGMSARLAAINAKPQDVEDLRIIISGEATAITAQKRAQINVKFHSLLVNLAGNRYLNRVVEDLSETLSLLGPTTLADNARFAEARSEHAAIVAAIADGDADEAEARMRAHVRGAWQARRIIMLSEPEEDSGVSTGTVRG